MRNTVQPQPALDSCKTTSPANLPPILKVSAILVHQPQHHSQCNLFFPTGGHGDEGRQICAARAGSCREDNRMCPGSAVEGRRIQGSYCTLWNGLRNARCLPWVFFFFSGSGSYHMLEATGFEANGMHVCVFAMPFWMLAVTYLHILLRHPLVGVQRRRGLPSRPSPAPSSSRHAGHLVPSRRWRLRGKTRHLCEKDCLVNC